MGTVRIHRGPGGSSLMLPGIPDRCGEGEPLRAGDVLPDSCAVSYAAAIGQ